MVWYDVRAMRKPVNCYSPISTARCSFLSELFAKYTPSVNSDPSREGTLPTRGASVPTRGTCSGLFPVRHILESHGDIGFCAAGSAQSCPSSVLCSDPSFPVRVPCGGTPTADVSGEAQRGCLLAGLSVLPATSGAGCPSGGR